MREEPLPVRRYRWVVGLLLAAYGLLGARLFELQVLRRPELLRLAAAQRRARLVAPPPRGALLDRHGVPLVLDCPGWDVAVRLDSRPPPPADRAARVAALLGLDSAQVAARLARAARTGARWVEVARGVARPGLPAAARRLGDWVSLTPRRVRLQPAFPLAEGLLGRYGAVVRWERGPGGVRIPRRALAGLEAALDPLLRGEPAVLPALRDGHRRLLLLAAAGERAARPGWDVVLTLDRDVQEVVEEALQAVAHRWQPHPGAGAVVLNGRTGEILALASWPWNTRLDRWIYGRGGEGPLRRVPWLLPLTQSYPPGSAFKPFVVAEALEGPRPWRLTDPIDAGSPAGTYGPVRLSRRWVRNHRGRRFGVIPLAEALYRSSNVALARLAEKLGPARMGGLMTRLGFRLDGRGGFVRPPLDPLLARLGLVAGRTSPPRRWRVGFTDVAWSFGQEIQLPLLQLAELYTALATDGTVRPAHLVRFLRRPGGEVASAPRPAEQPLFRPETARAVAATLTRVLSERHGTLAALGRRHRAWLRRHPVAGKTGTATAEDPEVRRALAAGRGHHLSENICHLVLFGPVGVKGPRYVVALVAPHPRRRPDGREPTAGEVLGEAALAIFRFLLGQPSEGGEGPWPEEAYETWQATGAAPESDTTGWVSKGYGRRVAAPVRFCSSRGEGMGRKPGALSGLLLQSGHGTGQGITAEGHGACT